MGPALWLGGCAQAPLPGGTDAADATPSGSAGHAAGTGRVVVGARGVALPTRVLLADGDGLVSAPVPPTSAPVRHELGGRVGQLAALGGRVLVTVAEPSALLVLGADDLAEVTRVPLPTGAHGLAITADGHALVTSEAAAELSLVDVAAGAVKWSVAVPAAPRQVVLAADGARAWLTHRVATGLTEVTAGGASWRDAPAVAPPTGEGARVEGLGALLGDGRVGFVHGLLAGGRVRPELSVVSAESVARWHSAALGDGTFVRAAAPRAEGRWLVSTDDALMELEAKEGDAVHGRASHACRDATAMAVTVDERSVYLSCGGGRVAVASLPLSSATPVAYHASAAASDEACSGVVVEDERISKSYDETFLGAAEVEKVLRRYHCRHRDRTLLRSIAKSHGGRDVWALSIGTNDPHHTRPTIFINGGHHGDELMALSFALDALKALLEEDVAKGAFEDVVFVVVPLVNPDGNFHRLTEHLLGRKNGRDNDASGKRDHEDGVDLNRNYPFRWGALGENGSRSKATHKWYRGPAAGSEPETRGVMALANREKFVGAVSFHTGTLAMCAPYTIPDVKNPEPDAGWLVAQEIVSQMPQHPEGPIPVKRRLYPLDGNDQDWHRHQNGTLAFLWEGAKNWLSYPRFQLMRPARASWMLLAKRFAEGPAFSLSVTDAAGRPLVAEVKVKEIAHYEGERWTTRCRDGRFDFILPTPGAYTLVVSAGGAEVEHAIDAQRDGRVEAAVTLPVLATDAPACGDGGGGDRGAPLLRLR